MKTVFVVCLFAVVAMVCARPEEHYTDKYDNVNLDDILGNDRLRQGYVNCLLDKGKCTPDATELKGHVQEALENKCGKCTKAQQDGTRRVIGHLINHDDVNWKLLTAKYDPDNKYAKQYEDELRKVKA